MTKGTSQGPISLDEVVSTANINSGFWYGDNFYLEFWRDMK